MLGSNLFNKIFDILSNPLLVLFDRPCISLNTSDLSQGVRNILFGLIGNYFSYIHLYPSCFGGSLLALFSPTLEKYLPNSLVICFPLKCLMLSIFRQSIFVLLSLTLAHTLLMSLHSFLVFDLCSLHWF